MMMMTATTRFCSPAQLVMPTSIVISLKTSTILKMVPANRVRADSRGIRRKTLAKLARKLSPVRGPAAIIAPGTQRRYNQDRSPKSPRSRAHRG
jgi:hypothetical protein